jgi:hypothetical protein
MNSRSLSPLLALLPIIAFAIVVGAHTSSVSAAPTPPQNFREYDNAQWHFSMFVPNDFTAEVSNESGGVTIQFIDAKGNVPFQVSAWPYQDLVVHADGLQLQPASVDNDQPDELDTVHVYQDGLFEISFVKNGIAYNVQALPDKATSTLDILKSWQFI